MCVPWEKGSRQQERERWHKVHCRHARQGHSAARCSARLCIVVAEARSCICPGTLLHALLLLYYLSHNEFRDFKDGGYVQKSPSNFKLVAAPKDHLFVSPWWRMSSV